MITSPITSPILGAIFSQVDAAGGGSGIAQFPAKTFYFNDFSADANNTTLRSLSGWSAYNSGASTSAVRDQWQVQSNALTRMNVSTDFATAPGLLIIGRDTGSTNHTIRCKITSLPASGNIIYIAVASSAENNSAFFQCTNTSGVMQNFILSKNVGGTTTQLLSQAGATSGLGRALQVGDEIELQVIGQFLHLFVNGRRITPDAGTSLDTGGAFTKGNVCGFGTRSSVGAVFDDVYVAAIGGAATMAATPIFWPGSIAQAGRSVPLSGTYSGDVQALDYRVLNDSTGTVVKDWARITGATIAAGAWSGSVFVPMGSIATNPKVRLQVRAANDTDVRVMSGATTVGIAVGSYGQSNSAYRGQPTATSHAVAHAYTWSQDDSSAWNGGGTATTRRSQLWATKIAERSGIPCGVFVFGVGSQSIENLTNSGAGSAYFDDLEAAATSANAYGYIQSWLWTQGENEAGGTNPFNEASYRSTFDALLGKLRSAIAARADAPVGVCVIGHTTGGHASGTTFGDANWSAVRAGHVRLADKPGVFVATGLQDATLTDALHYIGDAYVENGRRAGMSMAAALGYGGANGRGPLITGATRSGATITLAVDLNGASSISGTGLTNYQVSADDFATQLTISSAAVSGNTIVLTLSADPGASVKVRSFYGMDWTSPVRAIGNYADGTTIPVEPIYQAITAS